MTSADLRLVVDGPHGLCGNLALEALIAAQPADDAPRQVYADWLIGEGDPRGELIARDLAGYPVPRAPFFGAQHALAPMLMPTWRAGFSSRYTSPRRGPTKPKG